MVLDIAALGGVYLVWSGFGLKLIRLMPRLMKKCPVTISPVRYHIAVAIYLLQSLKIHCALLGNGAT